MSYLSEAIILKIMEIRIIIFISHSFHFCNYSYLMIKHYLNKARSKSREKRKSRSRSSRWDEVRDDFIRNNQFCSACGYTEELQVHHMKPFKSHPELELDPSNLITLCMGPKDCHLFIGHGGNFKFHVPDLLDYIEVFKSGQTKLALQLARINRRR